jgi:hypothetical protein
MNTANSGGRERPIGHAGTAKQAPGRPSICKALREGIEAALRTDPAALANRKPRTGLELLIRGAVLNAHEGCQIACNCDPSFASNNDPHYVSVGTGHGGTRARSGAPWA